MIFVIFLRIYQRPIPLLITGCIIKGHHCKSPQWPQSIPENLRIEPSMLLEAINGGDRSCDRSCSMEAIAVAIAVAINGGRAQFLNGGDRIWKRSQLRLPVAGVANLRLSSDLSAVQHVLILSGLMGPMPSAVILRSCEETTPSCARHILNYRALRTSAGDMLPRRRAL